MTQQAPRVVWNGSSEIVFAVGLFFLIIGSLSFYDRRRLDVSGITVDGIVQKVIPSNLSATDLVLVMYRDGTGQVRKAAVYAKSHQYSDKQTVTLKYLPTDHEIARLAPGERGERGGTPGDLFQVVVGGFMTMLGGILLVVKWGRRLPLYFQ